MTEYRLWTPNDTYRGTVEAETESHALYKRHRKDITDDPSMVVTLQLDGKSIDYDPDYDGIVWPDDKTRDQFGDIEDWTIEPVEESA